jgi:hypothetical protein
MAYLESRGELEYAYRLYSAVLGKCQNPLKRLKAVIQIHQGRLLFSTRKVYAGKLIQEAFHC